MLSLAPGGTSFENADNASNKISFTGTITNPPSGLEITPSCTFADDAYGIQCIADWGDECVWVHEPDTFECNIGIPQIDPNDADFLDLAGIFDAAGSSISLDLNTFAFGFEFNNGSHKSTLDFEDTIDSIEMDFIPQCGDGICNDGAQFSRTECVLYEDGVCLEYYLYPDLGEGYDSSAEYACCSDCHCPEADPENPEYYCDKSSENPPYVCRSRSGINLVVDTENSKAKCEIQLAPGYYEDYPTPCVFGTYRETISFYVDNPPSGVKIGGRDAGGVVPIQCSYPNTNQESGDLFMIMCGQCTYEESESTDTRLYYTCWPTVGGTIKDGLEGTIQKEIQLDLLLSYGGGSVNLEPHSTRGNISVEKTKSLDIITYENKREAAQSMVDGPLA